MNDLMVLRFERDLRLKELEVERKAWNAYIEVKSISESLYQKFLSASRNASYHDAFEAIIAVRNVESLLK